jgi:hypothetical protein
MSITDSQLALWWHRKLSLPDGEHFAPAARIEQVGKRRRVHPLAGLSASIAAMAPELAEMIEAALPAASPQAPGVALESLVRDYSPAASLEGAAPAEVFRERFAACQACRLWRLAQSGLAGHCDHVDCRCSHRLVWPSAESCPAGKW